MKINFGGMVSLGKGAIHIKLSHQNINTRSSTEYKITVVDNHISDVLYSMLVLDSQGYIIEDNLIFQDNHISMLMENNGKYSRGKKTRHIDMCYFCITVIIYKKEVSIGYFPTEETIGDLFSKPL